MAGTILGKIALIVLTRRLDDGISEDRLEHELRQAILGNDKILSKWSLERLTILDDH